MYACMYVFMYYLCHHTSVDPAVLLPSNTSSSVVLPEPEGPMTATSSPGLTYMFTWSKIVFFLMLSPLVSPWLLTKLLVSIPSPLLPLLSLCGVTVWLLMSSVIEEGIPESERCVSSEFRWRLVEESQTGALRFMRHFEHNRLKQGKKVSSMA